MQQSNRIALGSGETDLRSELRELNAAVYENPDLTEALIASRSDVSTPSEYQYYLVRQSARNQAVFFLSVQSAFDNGIIGNETFESYLATVELTLRTNPNWAPFFLQVLLPRDRLSPGRAVSRMGERMRSTIESIREGRD